MEQGCAAIVEDSYGEAVERRTRVPVPPVHGCQKGKVDEHQGAIAELKQKMGCQVELLRLLDMVSGLRRS